MWSDMNPVIWMNSNQDTLIQMSERCKEIKGANGRVDSVSGSVLLSMWVTSVVVGCVCSGCAQWISSRSGPAGVDTTQHWLYDGLID